MKVNATFSTICEREIEVPAEVPADEALDWINDVWLASDWNLQAVDEDLRDCEISCDEARPLAEPDLER